MIIKTIGPYTIRYEPALEVATVTKQGFLIPEIIHEEDGVSAFERCEAWIASQAPIANSAPQNDPRGGWRKA